MTARGRALAIVPCVGLGLMLSACGDDGGSGGVEAAGSTAAAPAGDPEAVGRCRARSVAVGSDFDLVGAFLTDVGTLRGWVPTASVSVDALPPRLATRADAEAVVVCFIDGAFATPGPPGHPTPERAVYYVEESGEGEPLRFGSSRDLPVERPRVDDAG